METTAMRSHLIFLCSLIVVIYAQLGPEIVSDHDPVPGITGTDVPLVCRQPPTAEGNITWKREDDTPIVDSDKYDIIVNSTGGFKYSTLIIKNVQLTDNGDYKCGQESSFATVELKVTMDANITIENIAGDFHLAKGTTIGCKSSNPNVTLSWSKGTNELNKGKQDLNKDGEDDLEVNSKNQVVLLSANPILAGEYNCTADLGTSSKSVFQHIVGELDAFTPKSIKVSEGEDGHMECRVRSISKPRITWLVNGTEIEMNDKYKITEKPSVTETDETISTLTIKKVTLEDGRPTNYTCSATNGVDVIDREIILRIRDRLAALWPFIGIVSEVVILIVIILIHEACTKGEDIGEVEDDEEDHLLQKNRNTITRDGERETRMRGTNN